MTVLLQSSIDKQATSAAQIEPLFFSVCSTGSIVVCLFLRYVLFLTLHECLTPFPALDTGRLLSRHSHHRTSWPCTFVLCLVLCLPPQPERGASAITYASLRAGVVCVLARVGRSWVCHSDLSRASVCPQLGPASHLCPCVVVSRSAPPTPAASCPKHTTLEAPGVRPSAQTPGPACSVGCVCATPRG